MPWEKKIMIFSLIIGSSLIKYPQAFHPGMSMPFDLGNLVQRQPRSQEKYNSNFFSVF